MTAILLFHHICGKRLHPCFVTRIEYLFNFPCSVTNDYTFHGGHLLLSHTGVSLPGKSGRHVIMLNKKPILSLMYPGWKLELNADANPGRTGDDDGTPAAAAAAATAAACSGATEATDDTEDPGSPMKEDNTGLPAPGPPEPPKPGKVAWLSPGGRPGNREAQEVVRPSPKGEAAPGYMEVCGCVLRLLVEAIEEMEEGRLQGGREVDMVGKWERLG